jgi:hypothetical protein
MMEHTTILVSSEQWANPLSLDCHTECLQSLQTLSQRYQVASETLSIVLPLEAASIVFLPA